MRRDVLWIVLGLLVGAAPLAIGQEEDGELLERLHALQAQLHKQINRHRAVDQLAPLNVGKFQLAVLPVADLTMGRYDHIRPDHRIGCHEESEHPLFGNLAEEAPQPFGTIEELLELVRGSVWPDSWENDGAAINASQGKLVVLQTPPVMRDIQRFLDQNLRNKAHTCVTVEAEVVTVSTELFKSLSDAATLSTAKRHALDQALQAKTAQRIFAGRVTGFAGQRQLMWHGKQVAIVADADVEVAQDARTTNPVVEVVQAGGYISVRADHAGDTDLRIDAEIRFDELEGIELRETGRNGTLDVPKIRNIASNAVVRVAPRTWALVASGKAADGNMRIVLLRGTRLARLPAGNRGGK